MFRVIQLFVFIFVFGQIVHKTIRIQPNSLKPLFGTSLAPIDRPISRESSGDPNLVGDRAAHPVCDH